MLRLDISNLGYYLEKCDFSFYVGASLTSPHFLKTALLDKDEKQSIPKRSAG